MSRCKNSFRKRKKSCKPVRSKYRERPPGNLGIAFSDLRELYDCDRWPKIIHGLDDATATISSMSSDVRGQRGRLRVQDQAWRKNSAQERLLMHLGLFRKENSNIANDNKTIRAMATHERVTVPLIFQVRRIGLFGHVRPT